MFKKRGKDSSHLGLKIPSQSLSIHILNSSERFRCKTYSSLASQSADIFIVGQQKAVAFPLETPNTPTDYSESGKIVFPVSRTRYFKQCLCISLCFPIEDILCSGNINVIVKNNTVLWLL